jgi:beta-ureidopropionase
MTVSKEAERMAKDNNFVIQAYRFDAGKEDTRKPRTVKIAAVQHAVSAPLTDPIGEQKRKTFEKVGKIIDAAAKEGVNILCLQELWCKGLNFI